MSSGFTLCLTAQWTSTATGAICLELFVPFRRCANFAQFEQAPQQHSEPLAGCIRAGNDGIVRSVPKGLQRLDGGKCYHAPVEREEG